MKRRDAIKNLSLSMGYVVAAPTLMNMLSACTAEGPDWIPEFLSKNQKTVVTHLVDIILPATDISGALDVNVPQFIDKMYENIENENKQKRFNKGSAVFIEKYEAMFDKDLSQTKRDEVEKLFATHFDLPANQREQVLEQQKKSESEFTGNELDMYFMYNFLFSVRQYALFGYYTSEKVGEQILNYDPVPGSFDPCVPLADIGNSWSL